MAGTVTTTEERIGPIEEIIFAWTSSGAGAADATSTYAYNGEVMEVQIIPGATTPTNLYDVTVSDNNSVDMLYGQGANVSNASTTVVKGCALVANSKITLGVTNAGSAKDGTIIVHVR